MRLFVRSIERACSDPQERAAMLVHRLSSIVYKRQLLQRRGPLAYAFRNDDGTIAIELYEVSTLEEADVLIKRDPQFPYTAVEVIPVVSTQAMVREASEYIGKTILDDEELESLALNERRDIDPQGSYVYAYKEVRPFSPLLSQQEQDQIHTRTITSQRAHHSKIEFADDNPVGRSVGILVAEGTVEDVRAHVARCEVFPDTVVTFLNLLPLERAWLMAADALKGLGRSVPKEPEFNLE